MIGTAVVLAPGNPLGGCFLYQFFEGNYGLIHPSNTGGRGVAFFAHVGGFIFGAIVARILLAAGRITPTETQRAAYR